MGGPDKSSATQIGGVLPPTRPSPSSESASTYLFAREECVGQRHWGADETFLDPDLPSHGCGSTPKTTQEALSRLGGNGARAASHLAASTSPRCSLQWVTALLEARLVKWTKEDAQDCKMTYNEVLNDPEPAWRYKSVPQFRLRHIIGRGGRVLRRIESFCGVFLLVSDFPSDSREGDVGIIGPRRACLLAEFVIEMLVGGNFSILTSLAHHGF